MKKLLLILHFLIIVLLGFPADANALVTAMAGAIIGAASYLAGGATALGTAMFGTSAAAMLGGAMVWGAAVYGALGTAFKFISGALTPDLPEIGTRSKTYDSPQPMLSVASGIPIAEGYGRCLVAGNVIRQNDQKDPEYIKLIVAHCKGEIDGMLGHFVNNSEFTRFRNPLHQYWQHNGAANQTAVTNLFNDAETCNYRGVALTEYKIKKSDEVQLVQNISVIGRLKKCLEIGQNSGGTESFTRNPAQILWDFRVKKKGNSTSDLNTNAFTALKTYCAAYPTEGESTELRPPIASDDLVAATSYYDINLKSKFALDKTAPLIGNHKARAWLSAAGQTTNQRINIDFGVGFVIDGLIIENYHNSGILTNRGIQNFIIQGSNSAASFADTTYASTGWTDIETGLTALEHTASDVANPETFSWVNTTEYRYIAIKIANNYGSAAGIGIRDLQFLGRTPRYTFDFNFDTKISINDAEKLIWKSFNGKVIRSQGKFKPVWDAAEEHDGAGGLQAKAVRHTFTMDNIVKGSFEFHRLDHPNTFMVNFVNAHNSFQKDMVVRKDARDIAQRGEIVYDETCWYVTERSTAKRRATLKYNKGRYPDYVCTLTGFPDSQDVEVFDRVQVTHSSPGWTLKDFIVTNKDEDQYGRSVFLLEAYLSGVYDDRGFEEQPTYQSLLPNPNLPSDHPEDVTVTFNAVGAGAYSTGSLTIAFTPPNDPYYSYSSMFVSTDDITYYYAGDTDGGHDAYINGMGILYQVGDTVYIKLQNVNANGVKEIIPSVYDATETIGGAIRLASWYLGQYDMWGGNADIANAATKVVIGNLDGTPKIALGASADAITFAGTEAGFIVDGNGNVRFGNATYGVKFDVSGGTLAITGTITATAGTIGGFTLSAAALYAGTGATRIQLDTSSGIHLGATAFADAPFRVALNGALVATSATITGVITANTGKIGGADGWVISAGYLKDVAGVVGLSSVVTGGDDIRFWAGHATPASAPFRVTEAGVLVATSATITGAITATSGTIAGFTVDPTEGLYAGTGATRVQMKPGAGIWTGATVIGDAPFSATNAGVIKATSGTIGGWTLASTTLSSANIILDRANDKITVNTLTIDGANNRIRSSNYVSGYAGAGFTLEPDLLEIGNIAARGMIRTAVFQKDVISCIGGNLFVRPADVLATDMIANDGEALLDKEDADSLLLETGSRIILDGYVVMTIEGNETFTVNDILRIKDGTNDEWMRVVDIGDAPTYYVRRDMAANYAVDTNPTWKKGASVVSYGISGKGGIYLTSSEANAPYMSMFTHAGSPWTTITTRLRIGNLNGTHGYSSEIYGLALGPYGGAGLNWITIDDTNGIRFGNNVTPIWSLNASGVSSLTINAGGDITLAGSDSNPARIIFDGSTYSTIFGVSQSGGVFGFWPSNAGLGYFAIGMEINSVTGTIKRFNDIVLLADNTISLSVDDGSNEGRITVNEGIISLRTYNIGVGQGRVLIEDNLITFEIAGSVVGGFSSTEFTVLGNIVMANNATIGQAAGPLIAFDDTNNYLEITGCKVGIGTTGPGAPLEVSAAKQTLPLAIFRSTGGGTATGISLYTGNTNAASRNWAMSTSYDNYGDFAIRVSNALGGDPFGAGTTKLTILMSGYVGFGIITPDTLGHFHKATAGAVTAVANTVLTIENSTHAYLSFLVPAASECGIVFGDVNDNVAGKIIYDHSADYMYFWAVAAPKLILGNTFLAPPSTAGLDLGTDAVYFNDINYKTLDDRGCLGWFDDGVELQSGKIVTDLEALMQIKKHPTKLTVFGLPALDYKSLPKPVYTQAGTRGSMPNWKYYRDENDEPWALDEKGEKHKVEDGAEISSLISIMVGGIRELKNHIKQLEQKVELLKAA